MKDNKIVIIFIGVLIISCAFLNFSPPINKQRIKYVYSVDNPYSNGYEALYEVCKKMDINTEKYNYDSAFLDTLQNKTLVYIGKIRIKDDKKNENEERKNLIAWVRKGNKAILICDGIDNIDFKTAKSIKGYKVKKIGKGELIFSKEYGKLLNKNIGKNEEINNFINLLQTIKVKNIIFNEYIHGYGANMTVWDVLPVWTKLCTLQIILFFIGIGIMNIKRFGRADILEQEEYRFISEYYTSVSNLYEQSNDYSGMMKEYLDIFIIKLLKKYGVGKKVDYDMAKIIWQERKLNNYELLKKLVGDIQGTSGVNESKFSKFIFDVDSLRKEIGA